MGVQLGWDLRPIRPSPQSLTDPKEAEPTIDSNQLENRDPAHGHPKHGPVGLPPPRPNPNMDPLANDPRFGKTEPNLYDYKANGYTPPSKPGGYGIKQDPKLAFDKLSNSEQVKFNQWKNAAAEGTSPVDAAKLVGDSDVKKLKGTSNNVDQWQFRLSKDMRVSFTFDDKLKTLDVIGIGHT